MSEQALAGAPPPPPPVSGFPVLVPTRGDGTLAAGSTAWPRPPPEGTGCPMPPPLSSTGSHQTASHAEQSPAQRQASASGTVAAAAAAAVAAATKAQALLIPSSRSTLGPAPRGVVETLGPARNRRAPLLQYPSTQNARVHHQLPHHPLPLHRSQQQQRQSPGPSHQQATRQPAHLQSLHQPPQPPPSQAAAPLNDAEDPWQQERLADATQVVVRHIMRSGQFDKFRAKIVDHIDVEAVTKRASVTAQSCLRGFQNATGPKRGIVSALKKAMLSGGLMHELKDEVARILDDELHDLPRLLQDAIEQGMDANPELFLAAPEKTTATSSDTAAEESKMVLAQSATALAQPKTVLAQSGTGANKDSDGAGIHPTRAVEPPTENREQVQQSTPNAKLESATQSTGIPVEPTCGNQPAAVSTDVAEKPAKTAANKSDAGDAGEHLPAPVKGASAPLVARSQPSHTDNTDAANLKTAPRDKSGPVTGDQLVSTDPDTAPSVRVPSDALVSGTKLRQTPGSPDASSSDVSSSDVSSVHTSDLSLSEDDVVPTKTLVKPAVKKRKKANDSTGKPASAKKQASKARRQARGGAAQSKSGTQDQKRKRSQAGAESVDKYAVCGICGEVETEVTPTSDPGIVCDGCDQGFHLRCVKLKSLPLGEWLCGICQKARGKAQKPPKRARPTESSR
eukprot:m.258734 g.258734  ORF g.258734 m.258734 type:complete len:680 (+) comp19197_c0_seq3:265-2304(+)